MHQQFIPITHHHLGRFNTANGHIIDLHEPDKSKIIIEDIAVALSNICRFGGQIKNFYSVAQHSVLVAHLAPAEIKKEALMHDAAEAYVGDVIKPLKEILGDVYETLEMLFMAEICLQFGLRIDVMKLSVKPFDIQALELEHQAFHWNNPIPLMVEMNKANMLEADSSSWWDPEKARKEFMRQFNFLFNR